MNKQNKFKEAVIAVTYRCNLRCTMCNIWQKKDFRELPKEGYLKLPKSLQEINITGGEPFLRSDLIEVISNIIKACPKAHLTFSSNGYTPLLIFQKIKDVLKITKNISVAISLDGLGKRHDQIRGRDSSFKNALTTIDKLKELGLAKNQLKIAFTLSDNNYDQLEKVYQLAKQLKIDFTLAAVHNSENYFSIQNNQLAKSEELKKSLENIVNQELKSSKIKKWFRAYFAYGLWYFIATGKRLLPDYSGSKTFFLDPVGNVFSSNISSHLLGNIKNFQRIDFSKSSDKDPQSWMICTARLAIKKNLLKVACWILRNKLKKYVSL